MTPAPWSGRQPSRMASSPEHLGLPLFAHAPLRAAGWLGATLPTAACRLLAVLRCCRCILSSLTARDLLDFLGLCRTILYQNFQSRNLRPHGSGGAGSLVGYGKSKVEWGQEKAPSCIWMPSACFPGLWRNLGCALHSPSPLAERGGGPSKGQRGPSSPPLFIVLGALCHGCACRQY